MRAWLGSAAVAVAMVLPIKTATAQEQVLGFEGIGSTGVPTGYGGMTWSTSFNWWQVVATSGSLFRPSSGSANAASDEMSFISFSRPGELFDLNSMFLGEYLAPGRTDIGTTIYGFRDGEMVYSMPVTYDVNSMTQVDFGWTNVDKVTLGGAKGRVLVDDISVTATPEPATVALVGTGILGLFLVRRRKSKAKTVA
ncbi:MAG TPA: PEP-CTERM sorting domain-containing protein [Gemmatimonadaceae bacterium]|nr:PEP-CTERM sorting domain-containing protein [Gemmatimonadaceae bacterium]